jgi:putative ABC transport system permease protein
MLEACAVVTVAGVVGASLAWAALPALVAAVPEGTLPNGAVIVLDWRVLAAMVGVTGVVALACGAIPAWLSLSGRRDTFSRHGHRRSSSMSGSPFAWDALVACEVGVAMALSVWMIMAGHSLAQLRSAPLGFTPDGVISLGVSLSPVRYGDPERRAQFIHQVLERYRGLPGVTAASVGGVPVRTGQEAPVAVDDGFLRQTGRARVNAVGADYLSTLRIPILRGREISRIDEAAARPVAVVNVAFARRFLAGREPVGRTLHLTGADDRSTTAYEIVGLSNDVSGPVRTVASEVYVPLGTAAAATGSNISLIVRTAGEPAQTIPALRRELWMLDPAQPFGYIRSADDELRAFAGIGWMQFKSVVFWLFGSLALLLAGGGTYGILSFRASREAETIGLMMALGAQRGTVMAHVVGRGLRATGLGIIVGGALAVAGGTLVQATLSGIATVDAWAVGAAATLLLVVAALAAYLPARRAAGLDPARTLSAGA